jgi:hypothetical protein
MEADSATCASGAAGPSAKSSPTSATNNSKSAERRREETKMLTTVEMARAEFGFYAAHIALHNGDIEPLHEHTFQVTLRVSGEPDT